MRRKREETKEEHGDVSLSIEETNKCVCVVVSFELLNCMLEI